MGKVRHNKHKPIREGRSIKVGRAESVPSGRGATVQLNDGSELALFNVGGTFYAIENFCPHKGYPLADSPLKGTTVICEHHDWMFDVRTGHCFTAPKCSIEKYPVRIEDGWIFIDV
ncbi:Rieske (2Fe-2S) protein [Leptolyngbya sp. 7M]|uniref:Rieske (2Fe-2S) protein n=1 Tax=Leptolyngbya sp. 7M TaxID=2812896 RepID=UPI001B8B38D9|nr:Rieske (2Fe-2S) protein [Leptolyngbya sp. 7M]QYO65772.1 Rieske (2Fe-2S) protein [Leptolyngbya sp. 7M]